MALTPEALKPRGPEGLELLAQALSAKAETKAYTPWLGPQSKLAQTLGGWQESKIGLDEWLQADSCLRPI